MLTVHHIHKSFGLEPVLRDISFSINPGEKVGLVGANGCGKTTLLRIIMELEPADGGSVQFTPPDLRVGYLPQGFAHRPDDTIASFIQRMEGDLDGLSARLEHLAAELAAQPRRADLQRDYDDTLARLTLASETAGRGPSMLAAFGLGDFPPETPAAALSGGQKTRLALAGVLLSAPALLLLDEPTNHLDLEMMAWLENWLVAFRGAALIVSHDRAFLNRTAASILELDGLTHALRAYPGNYDAYLDQKAGERERQWQQYTDQQAEIVRLRRSAAAMRSDARYHPGGKTDPNKTDGFSIGFFANRSKEVIQKAKNIEKRVEHLLTDEHVDKPARTWQMKIEFGDTPESARSVVTTDELAIGYDGRPLLAGINLYLRYGERVALIGPNGCGKTTLLRTIAGMLPPVAGSVRLGGSVRPGYMTQEQEELNPALNPLETILELHPGNLTEARSFLSKFLFKGDDVFTPVRSLSYGERSRLSLACLVARGCNLLLLDEPINHLDIPARTRFEESLAAFEGTILAVVHDRYFIQNFASHIWEVRGGRVLTYPYTPLTFAAAFQPPAGSDTTSRQEESNQ